jgi:hypothetical protein
MTYTTQQRNLRWGVVDEIRSRIYIFDDILILHNMYHTTRSSLCDFSAILCHTQRYLLTEAKPKGTLDCSHEETDWIPVDIPQPADAHTAAARVGDTLRNPENQCCSIMIRYMQHLQPPSPSWQTAWALVMRTCVPVPKQSILVGDWKGTVICVECYTWLEKGRKEMCQKIGKFDLYTREMYHAWKSGSVLYPPLPPPPIMIQYIAFQKLDTYHDTYREIRIQRESITKPNREWYEPWTLRRISRHAFVISHNGVLYKLA